VALVPCYRGCVNAWECDENDHLNVRLDLATANQGLPFVLEAIGAWTARIRSSSTPSSRSIFAMRIVLRLLPRSPT